MSNEKKCQTCGQSGADEVYRPGTFLCKDCLDAGKDTINQRWTPEDEEQAYQDAAELGLQGQDIHDYVDEQCPTGEGQKWVKGDGDGE